MAMTKHIVWEELMLFGNQPRINKLITSNASSLKSGPAMAMTISYYSSSIVPLSVPKT